MSAKRIWIMVSLALALALAVGSQPVSFAAREAVLPAPAVPAPNPPVIGGQIGIWFPVSLISNTAGHEDEREPALAFNSSWNEYLVVWRQTDGSVRRIYGQLISSGGAMFGQRFEIPVCSERSQEVKVTFNPHLGQYLVVTSFQGDPKGVCASRLTNVGNIIGTPQILVSDSTAGFYDPAVAVETSNIQYLVAWTRVINDPYQTGIEALSLNEDGSASSGILSITGMQTVIEPKYPDAACVRTLGGCLLVWQQWYCEDTCTDHDFLAQRLHMEGGVHTEGIMFAIFGEWPDEQYPAIAAIARDTGIGQYLVIGRRDLLNEQLVGRSVTDAGGMSDPFIINGSAYGHPPAVAGSESAQEYLVAWRNGSTPDIRMVTVSTLGVVGAETVADPPAVDATSPAVVAGQGGDFVVVKRDYMTGYTVSDIFALIRGIRTFLYVPVARK